MTTTSRKEVDQGSESGPATGPATHGEKGHERTHACDECLEAWYGDFLLPEDVK